MTSRRSFSRKENDGLDRRSHGIADTQPITILENAEIPMRLKALGLEIPGVAILPRNFGAAKSSEEFVFEQMTTDVQKIGRKAGLTVQIPGPEGYRSIHEKDAAIIAPVMVFAHQFLVEGGAALVARFLEDLGQHVATRWGRQASRDRQAIFEAVVTKGPHAKSLRYVGDVRGLPTIAPILEKLFEEN